MRHEDIFNAAMSIAHGTSNYRVAASRYRVSDRKILEAAMKLESTQEERDTPLTDS